MRKIHNNNSELFMNFLSYLLILLLFFLISCSFLFYVVFLFFSFFFFFFLKNKKFFLNYFFFFFIIFWILILISSSLAEDKILSFKSSIFYFRFLLFSLFVWWILEVNKKILNKIYIVLLFCFLIIIFDSFFQYINGSNIFNMELVEQNRVSSFFGDELKMGGFLMRLFPVLVALTFFFYKKKKHEKLIGLSILLLFLILLTVFLSGGRTSFFLFNFTIILFLLFLNDFKRIRFFIFICFTCAISFLTIIDSPFKKRIIDLSLNQTQIKETGSPKYIFSKQYNEHYLSAWKMFKDNVLIGVGPKNFRVKCKEDNYNFSKLTCSSHPHNFALQLLAETGFFSFLIYLIVNIVVWYNLFKNLFSKIFYKKKILNNFQISLLISIVILIWPLSPNGSIFNNWLSIILYYPVGILLWEFRNSKKMFIKHIKK